MHRDCTAAVDRVVDPGGAGGARDTLPQFRREGGDPVAGGMGGVRPRSWCFTVFDSVRFDPLLGVGREEVYGGKFEFEMPGRRVCYLRVGWVLHVADGVFPVAMWCGFS